MTYGIEVLPQARSDLKELDTAVVARIARRIDGLLQHPRAFGTEELAGDLVGLRKLRLGDYRVIYALDDDRRVVSIWGIGHRRSIYDMMRRRVE